MSVCSLELVQNILFIYPGHEEELAAGQCSWAVAATTLLIIWFARILEASDLSELHQLLGSAHVDLLGAGDPVSVSAKKCCKCFMLTPRSSSFSFVFIEAFWCP